jgi:Na+/H+ antiporter NhaD/arsenite permease-like protein
MAGIPIEFILFGLTLLGVAIIHHRTFTVAIVGLVVITAYKLLFSNFSGHAGFEGLVEHLDHHWVETANLGLLLLGFALLSRHFEESKLPDLAPDILPDNWTGGLALLAIVFVLSAFLDNIAGALIGATIATHVYKKRVHIGFLAAIVAASNAGGAGSVVGDTTTTMMWIAGKNPLDVLHAYVGSLAAFAVFAIPAARAQQHYSKILKHDVGGIVVDWARVAIVIALLVAVVGSNVLANIFAPELLHMMPLIGLALWGALLLLWPVRAPDWKVMPETLKGATFLLSLVLAASMMPVDQLPTPSWESAFSLGFISAVFDNIPLTALALQQGNYDWGMLAYTVGFGGSMMWFGSSAGVAVCNMFPEAKSVLLWLRMAWFVPAAYVVGFFVMLGIMGWHPQP